MISLFLNAINLLPNQQLIVRFRNDLTILECHQHLAKPTTNSEASYQPHLASRLICTYCRSRSQHAHTLNIEHLVDTKQQLPYAVIVGCLEQSPSEFVDVDNSVACILHCICSSHLSNLLKKNNEYIYSTRRLLGENYTRT
jgi:hypothetical protein